MTKIALLQFTETFKGYYFYPYSVGVLQAYAQKHLTHPERFQFLLPMFKREPVHELLPTLYEADILAFSAYVWNIQLCLTLAEKVKAHNKDALVLFGGPQVPNNAHSFMQDHPQVDLCIHGEGEQTFTEILENYEQKSWTGIEGLSYRKPDGSLHQGKPRARAKDLSDFPSPYLEGVFDPLMDAYPHYKWMASWETNRGCPFRCTFCDWGSAIGGKIYQIEMERLKAEMDWFGQNKVAMIFCCDANFSIFKRDLEIAQYLADTKRRYGYPLEFHQQTAKNSTERNFKTHQILAEAGVFSDATISLQSMDAGTLKSIKRENISLDSYIELQQRFIAQNISSYTDLILGLPGETYDTFADGIERAINLGQHSRLQIYNAMILPNAEMADPAYRQQYGIETAQILLASELRYPDDVIEKKEIIVGTAAMPKSDWIKAKSLSWMVKCLYFHHKPVQIPIILLKTYTQIGFRQIFEAFLNCGPEYPVLYELNRFFRLKAAAIQQGDEERCAIDRKAYQVMHMPDWNVVPELFALLEMSLRGQVDAFYIETWRLLEDLLKQSGETLPEGLLYQATAFNSGLFKVSFMIAQREPKFSIHRDPIVLQLTYNLETLYEAALLNQTAEILPQQRTYYKNWAGEPYGLSHI